MVQPARMTDLFRLDRKTAVVTGASAGIGQAIAELFAQQGAFVHVLDRDERAGRATVEKIQSTGGNAEFAAIDVSDPAAVDALGTEIGNPDILVNNAGIGHVGDITNTTAADLDRLHAINVRGPFNLCHTFVPGMIGRGSGSVINIASVGGIVAVRERLAYTTSKFAVVGLTKALALDHSHQGVRFNAICPGRVETTFVQDLISQYPDPEKAYQDMASTQLTGRLAQPAEIAAAALYLGSDVSAMVTGSTMMIDGGWTAGK
ncbi:MAG: SDR family oxidoreductase [Synoicihabitans sp.]